jgi:16S rRNA (uracil1498-N3)-methyltransferase
MRSPADAVPSWVWVPELATVDAIVELDAAAAHHVHRVCRARAGDALVLSDGAGQIAEGRLEDVKPRSRVRVTHVRRIPPPPDAVLWCGEPERDRADWLVEKLAELGLTAFQPVRTERARWEAVERRRERWDRLALAALQQSRGAWRMSIEPARDLAELLANDAASGACWLADAAGNPPEPTVPGAPWTGAVGPSPGWTPDERGSLVARGFQPIRLAQRRLRSETAGVALASMWAARGAAGDS